MSAKLVSIRMAVIPDEDPDWSYLEQEGLGFEDRLAAFHRGDFGFVGVRAIAEVWIPHGDSQIVQEIGSPGLWGIEDDSGDEYLQEVFADECVILRTMLRELGIDPARAIAPVN